MSIYLVDFENVTSEGLSGVARLAEEDNVILFYSANAHKISLNVHRAICNTKAKVSYFEVAVGGKNALDHQLSTYLGYLIGQNRNMQYFIVSKDRGYQYLSDFWKNTFLVGEDINIKRIDSIKIVKPEIEVVPEDVKEEQGITNKQNDTASSDISNQIDDKKDSIMQNDVVLEHDVEHEVCQDTIKEEINNEDLTKAYLLSNQSKVVDIMRVSTTVKVDNKKEEFSNRKSKDNNKIINRSNNSIKTKADNKIISKSNNNIKNKMSMKDTRKFRQADIFERDIRMLIEEDLEEENLKKIIECFKNSKTKQELHIKIIGVLGRQEGPTIYNKIKPLMSKVERNATIEVDIREIVDADLREEQLKQVIECFRQSNSKQELHIKVIGALGKEKGPEIYNKIKKLMSKIS